MEIRKLENLSPDDFTRVMTGYTSANKYIIERTEKPEMTTISLKFTRMTQPYVKKFAQPPGEMERYQQIVKQGTSIGAYDGDRLVGLAIAERRGWNRSLWVWELGVEKEHRREGIGTKLVERLVSLAKDLELRVIVCETQNTNMPAIKFYRKTGFELDGIDLSYYTNADITTGEVAIFMKKKLN